MDAEEYFVLLRLSLCVLGFCESVQWMCIVLNGFSNMLLWTKSENSFFYAK